MHINIITTPLQLTIHGFGGIAVNHCYAHTAFELSGRMWQLIKAFNIPNKGKNIWVYESHHAVFAGVELEQENNVTILEKKTICLNKYAYYKHTGAYSLLKQTTQSIIQELKASGYQVILPNIEIYGHWTNDESQLEKELLFALQ
ncbi:MAG: hypothetical protein C0459_08600 [Chitinophaga sp.]|jgi:effector-binding domain-containing protein|nr:hypothetical protein [Chitinophaga sp.]